MKGKPRQIDSHKLIGFMRNRAKLSALDPIDFELVLAINSGAFDVDEPEQSVDEQSVDERLDSELFDESDNEQLNRAVRWAVRVHPMFYGGFCGKSPLMHFIEQFTYQANHRLFDVDKPKPSEYQKFESVSSDLLQVDIPGNELSRDGIIWYINMT
jgi:hypothetical protein